MLVLVLSGLFYFILYIYIVIINSDDEQSLPKRRLNDSFAFD